MANSENAVKVIGVGAVVVPPKVLMWGGIVVIGILLAGYIALFAWLGSKVVDNGERLSSIEARVEANGEKIDDLGDGVERLGDGVERGFERIYRRFDEMLIRESGDPKQ